MVWYMISVELYHPLCCASGETINNHSCPQHGRLIYLLVCWREDKLYPINLSWIPGGVVKPHTMNPSQYGDAPCTCFCLIYYRLWNGTYSVNFISRQYGHLTAELVLIQDKNLLPNQLCLLAVFLAATLNQVVLTNKRKILCRKYLDISTNSTIVSTIIYAIKRVQFNLSSTIITGLSFIWWWYLFFSWRTLYTGWINNIT